MSIDLHKMQVEIIAEINKFKKKCEAVKAEAKRTSETANKALSQIGDEKFASKATKQCEEIKKQTQATCNKIKQFSKQARIDSGILVPTKEYQALEKQISSVESQISKLKQKQEALSDKDAKEMTKSYSACAEQVKALEQRIDSMIAKQQSWVDVGVDPESSAAFKQLDEEIERANAELKTYQERMKQMETAGQAFIPSDKWKNLQREITAAREQIHSYKVEQAQLSSQGKDYSLAKDAGKSGKVARAYAAAGKRALSGMITESAKVHPALQKAIILAQKFGKTSKTAGNVAKVAIKGIAMPVKKVTSFLKILGTGFGKVYQRIRNGIGVLRRFGSSTNSLSNSCGKLLGKFGALRITATYMLASFMIMGGINAMKEGFKNLSQYSSQTNSDLSMLMSSLTQLKNSLATAFAPILTVIAPILNTFINWLSAAMTAVAHFMAAITGKNQVVVARKVNQDFAGSIADTGSAADGAADSVEKYKRSLMGFDQINKLDDQSNNSGGSGNGSGGAAGGVSPSDMFETVEVESTFLNWADKFKEAWENADFTDIGRIVGEKLNAALESIPWDKIKATSAKIAKSIATFLNGFIEATDWKLVGGTFAEGINTVIEFAYSFVTNFNWQNFGTAIGDAINGFFADLDLAKAGKTLSEGIKGILDTAVNLVETADWSAIGSKIADFFVNLDYIGIAKKIINLMGEAIVGALEGLSSFVDKVGDYLADYISSGDFWKDVFGAVKLTFELTAKIIGAAWTLLCSIIDNGIGVTINLIKSGAAWIWSLISGQDYQTAKKQIEIGFKLPENKVVDFVKELIEFLALPAPAKMQVVIDLVRKFGATIAEWLFGAGKTKGNESVNIGLIRFGWNSLKEFVGEKVSAKVGLIKSGWSKLTNWIGTNKKLSTSIKLVKSGWRKIKNWLGIANAFKLKFKLPRIKVKWGTKKVAGFTIKYPNGFSTYAKGGFPEEGPFMMNRGEIAGKFSNGKGVVANNQQITTGIANAVGPAVYKAVLSAMSERSDSKGNIIIMLQGDAKGLFRVIRQEAQNYTNATGLSAFPI